MVFYRLCLTTRNEENILLHFEDVMGQTDCYYFSNDLWHEMVHREWPLSADCVTKTIVSHKMAERVH